MRRRFQLQSVLDLREAAEEMQKRRVQSASARLAKSVKAGTEAENWIRESARAVVNFGDDAKQVEIAFALECLESSKSALNVNREEQARLRDELQKELMALTAVHLQAATVAKLRDHHLEEVERETKRHEQLALDESFRLLLGSRGVLDEADRKNH